MTAVPLGGSEPGPTPGRNTVPRARLLGARERAVPNWIVALLVVALGVHGLYWFWYLLVTPASVLTISPTWAGALSVTPTGQPAFIAGALGLSGALILIGSAHKRLHDLALFGHVVGTGTFAMLAGSFGYAAWRAFRDFGGILGAGNAGVFLLVAVFHVAFAYLRQRDDHSGRHSGPRAPATQ